jgi:hypothetical protein
MWLKHLPVGLGFGSERGQVVDLDPVKLLVRQRAERSLTDPVLARAAAAGADVTQLSREAMNAANAG